MNTGSQVERLLSGLSGEEQKETTYIFDNNVMGSGIPLSELYLALLKLQRKDAASISHQYEIFKARKAAYTTQAATILRNRNRKLRLIRYALQAASEGAADADIVSLGFTPEAFGSLRGKLDRLLCEQDLMKQTLHRLRNDPDSYQGEDVELEWIDVGQEEPVSDPEYEEEPDSQQQWSSDLGDEVSASDTR